MLSDKRITSLSKFLSLVLRHKPQTIGLELDKQGWTAVDTLIAKMNANGKSIDFTGLETIVKANNKQRFSFNEDKTLIRANQGHSIKIELGYQPTTPPPFLYHGTAERNLSSIFEVGLEKRNRHHGQLRTKIITVTDVGKRYGKPVILEVLAGKMDEAGFTFFKSENGVWLTDHVPVDYLRKMKN